MHSIRLGDEGTVLRATIYDKDNNIVNLSTTVIKEFRIRKPNGINVTKTASFYTDGLDGKIQYTFGTEEIDQVGRWQINAYVEFPSGNWNSTNGEFMVTN